MKHFIKELLIYILGFLFFAILTSICIYAIRGDFYYNYQEDYAKKQLQYVVDNQDVNLIAVGTSRTRSSFDPILFDELSQANTYSFNAGYVGISSYALMDHTNELLKINDNIKYLFLELTPYNKMILADNITHNRKIHEYSIGRYLENLNYIAHNNQNIFSAMVLLKNNLSGLLYKYTGFGIGKRINAILYGTHRETLTKKEEGVLSSERGQKKRTSYNTDPTDIIKNKEKYITFTSNEQSYSTEPDYLLRYKKFLKSIEDSGIKVYLIIYPGVAAVEDVLYQKQFLTEFTIIDMINPEKYPELYDNKKFADKAHLNVDGSKVFTTSLVEYFNDDTKK